MGKDGQCVPGGDAKRFICCHPYLAGAVWLPTIATGAALAVDCVCCCLECGPEGIRVSCEFHEQGV